MSISGSKKFMSTMALAIIAAGAAASVECGSPATAAAAPPVALRGTVAGGGAHMVVQVYAMPRQSLQSSAQPGATLRLYHVPSMEVTTSGSSYAVRLAPADLPDRVASRGDDVDFTVVASNPTTARYVVTSTTAHYVPGSSTEPARWTGPTPDPRAGHVSPRTGESSGVELSAAVVGKVSSRTERKRMTPSATGDYGIWGKKKQVWATIGTSYPVGTSASWMSYEADAGSDYTTTVGVAVNYDWQAGAGVGGEYSESGTKTLSQGVGFEWARSRAQRRYQVGVTYQHVTTYFSHCELTGVCRASSWQPIDYNGGTHDVTGLTRPRFTRCVPESKGVWHRYLARAHAYQNSKGVHLGFIHYSVSSKRQYSRNAELWYLSRTAHQRLCGNNADPAHAGQIMQKNA